MATAPAPLSAATDFARFGTLRAEAARDPEGAYARVAREFEALFYQMMLKAAREAMPEGGLFDSNALRFYREMFDSQVALAMAEQGAGLGLEASLRQQLEPAARREPGSGEERALLLPERRHFPESAQWYRPQPEPEVGDEVVDVATWRARVPAARPAQHAERFASSLRPYAVEAAARLGTTPEILLAQAALESGWGRHVMHDEKGRSSYNLFSIKADPGWSGRTVDVRTLEYFGGKPVRVNAAFRAYESYGAAFDDYVRFIEDNPRYRQALARAADPAAYIRELSRAGYATDPRYAHKVLEINGRLAAGAAVPDRG